MTRSWKSIVSIRESLYRQLHAERKIEWYDSGGVAGFRMPSILQCAIDCETVIVPDFLPGLPPTIAAITRFMFWDTDDFQIPVDLSASSDVTDTNLEFSMDGENISPIDGLKKTNLPSSVVPA